LFSYAETANFAREVRQSLVTAHYMGTKRPKVRTYKV